MNEPKKPVIKKVVDSLKVPDIFTNYQWYKNGVLLTNENKYYIKFQGVGTYYCTALDSNGCATSSDPVLATGLQPFPVNASMNLYPNPSNGLFTLELKTRVTGNIYIYDVSGKLLYIKALADKQASIDISHLPSAVYILKVVGENEVYVTGLIKE